LPAAIIPGRLISPQSVGQPQPLSRERTPAPGGSGRRTWSRDSVTVDFTSITPGHERLGPVVLGQRLKVIGPGPADLVVQRVDVGVQHVREDRVRAFGGGRGVRGALVQHERAELGRGLVREVGRRARVVTPAGCAHQNWPFTPIDRGVERLDLPVAPCRKADELIELDDVAAVVRELPEGPR